MKNGNVLIQKIDELNNRIWQETANDPVENLNKSRKNYDSAVDIGYELGQAESLLNIGRGLIYTFETKEAQTELNKALDLFRMIQGGRAEQGEIRTLNSLGVRAANDSEYETALNFYFMTLTRCELGDFDESRVRALNNIGEIHRILNNFEEALSYYHQASILAEKINDRWVKAITLLNIGAVQLKTRDFESAGENFKSALEIATRENYPLLVADGLIGQGYLLTYSGSYKEAEEKINAAQVLYEKALDKCGTAECRYRKGVISLRTSDYLKAEAGIKTVMDAAKELNNHDLLRRSIRRMAQIKKAQEEYREAIEYYEQFSELENIQRSDSLKNRLKKITIMYETEQTETEKEAYRMQSLRLEKANKEIRFINEIGKEITSSLDPEEIVTSAYERLSNLIEITTFAIATFNEKSKELDFHYIVEEGNRLEPIRVSLDNENSIAAWCVRNREPAFLLKESDAARYVKKWQHGAGSFAQSAIYLPVISRNNLVGCLTVQSSKKNAYSESLLDMLGAVSSFIGIALENSGIHNELNKLNEVISSEKRGLEVAYQKIAHMANHDSLTNLPNRHLLHELLESGLKAAKREKNNLAILYLDLDRFKPINDTFGHDTGDIVLTMVGERLCSTIRTSDTVARVGGDEFVVVLYNVEKREGAISVAKKIISVLNEEMEIEETMHRIGVSIGISYYPDDDSTIEGLLLKADKAMYKAKQKGKNQAAFFSE